MEALFELIFSNPIFAILLIMGLISFFNRLMGGQKSAEDESSGQRSHTSSHTERHPPRRRPSPDHGEQTTTQIGSIDVQRERQLEQLAGRMDTSLDPEQETEDLPESALKYTSLKQSETESHSHAQIKMKKRIQGKLTKKGLVDSVIMAEVLGPPRSRAPYENVLTKRR